MPKSQVKERDSVITESFYWFKIVWNVCRKIIDKELLDYF